MLKKHGLFLSLVLICSQACLAETISTQANAQWPTTFKISDAITQQTISDGSSAIRQVSYEGDVGVESCLGDSCAGGCGLCAGGGCFSPRYTVRGGALFMDRNNAHGVAFEDTVGDNDIAAPDLGFHGGFKVNVIRHRRNAHDLEVGFMGLFSDSGADIGAVNAGLQVPTLPPIAILGTGLLLNNYRSTLLGLEANLRSQHGDCLSSLIGFRWMMLDEDYGYTAFVPGGSPPQAVGGLSSTNNNLIGGQVGLDGVLCRRGGFSIEGGVQAGIYWNLVSHDGVVASTSGVASFVSEDADQLSFQGEADLMAIYRFSNRWAVRGGYQVMWIEGVALAPDQVSVLNTVTNTGIDVEGSPFYHGAVVDLELRF